MASKPSEQKEDGNDDENGDQKNPCCGTVNKVYLVSKGFYLFFFSAQGSLLPYLALFFKQLELPATQVGAITGFKPYIAFFFIPFWGCIADRFKKGKVLFLISMLAVISGMVAYALVPINICEIEQTPAKVGRAAPKISEGRSFSKAKRFEQVASAKLTNKMEGLGRNFKEPKVRNALLLKTRQESAFLTKRPSISHLIAKVSPKQENQKVAGNFQGIYEHPDKISMIAMNSRGAKLRESNSTSYDGVSEMADQSTEETPWSQSDMIALQDVKKKSSKKNTSLFLYLLLVTIFSTILSCPSLTLADTATVNLLRQNEETHKYGKQRLWGSIGYGSMAFTVGAAVSRIHLCPPGSARRKDVNYYPCFAVFVMCNLIALIIGSRFRFDNNNKASSQKEEENKDSENTQNEEDASDSNKKDRNKGIIAGLKLITQPRHAMFLMTAFYVGITMGFIRVFLFWHLKDLGGTQILFSFMAAINCVAEVTLYFLSSKLISYIGTVRVLYLGLTCYSLRLFYYAFVTNPWTVLPIELLSGITTAAVWAAMMSYVGTHSVEGAAVTLQGILHGVHWGLGHGSGELLGGFLISTFGASTTFAIFGAFSLIIMGAYILVNKITSDPDHTQDGYSKLDNKPPEET